jgi:hypothetical protein
MKRKKNVAANLVCVAIMLGSLDVSAQSTPRVNINRLHADSFWQSMPKEGKTQASVVSLVVQLGEKLNITAAEREALINARAEIEDSAEKYRIRLRDWGIKFWRRFPRDGRKYDWLLKTMMLQPHYFKDPEAGCRAIYEKQIDAVINLRELIGWRKEYRGFRGEFMRSNAVTEAQRQELNFRELIQEKDWYRWKDMEKTGKFDYLSWGNKAIRYCRYYYANLFALDSIATGLKNGPDRQQDYFINYFIGLESVPDMTYRDKVKYLELFVKSGLFRLEESATAKVTLLALQHHPFEVGSLLNLPDSFCFERYFGEATLVDIWSIECVGCIQRMPIVRDVYDRYKNDGFRVISVCIDPPEQDTIGDKRKAIGIDERIGADWPMFFSTTFRLVYRKYNLWGVPQLLLLDKRGNLIMYDDQLLTSSFENVVREVLKNK